MYLDDPVDGYYHALHLSKEKYGKAHIIARSFIDSLTKGEPIRVNDAKGLVHLSEGMQKCELTLFKLGYMSDLHSTETIRAIIKRLPFDLRKKWVERAATIIESNQEPNFSHLRIFIHSRARVPSSVYGEELANDSKAKAQTKSKAHNSNNKRRGTTLVTQSSGSPTQVETRIGAVAHVKLDNEQGQTDVKRNTRKGCVLCNENQLIAKCPKFIEYSILDRRNCVRENKICFNCLRYGHMAKGCLKKQQCTQCKGKHNDLVHDPEFRKRDTGSTTQD